MDYKPPISINLKAVAKRRGLGFSIRDSNIMGIVNDAENESPFRDRFGKKGMAEEKKFTF